MPHRKRALRRFVHRTQHRVLHALPAVVHIAPFRRLWYSQGVSQFGDAMYYLVFLYMIDNATKSPEQTGLAGALMQLPYLLFGFHAGMAADRVDRRLVMLWSDYASVAITIALFIIALFFPVPPGWILLVAGFLLSVTAAFYDPARVASIASLVPREKLLEANGLCSSTKTLMQLIGPIGTTILLPIFASAGERFFALAVLLNMATFAISAYYVRKLPPINAHQTTEKGSQSQLVKEFLEGLRFVWNIKVLRTGMLLTTFISLILAPILVGYTTANRLWFQGSERTFAGIQAAFFVGVVVSSLVVMKFKDLKPGTSYSFGMLAAGVCIGFLSTATNFWGFFFLNFCCGIAMPFAVIPITTYLQLVVPDELRGRVNSTMNMLTNIVLPIGWIAAGQAVGLFGVEKLFIAIGVGVILTALIGLSSSTFRKATMQDTAQPPTQPTLS